MGLFNRARTPAPTGMSLEQRDPKAATQSLRWTTPGREQAPDWNADNAYRVAYYMDPIAYASVRAIAETISGLKFLAGAIPGDKDKANPNARLAKMLGSDPPNGPCPGLGASDLWFAAVRDYLVAGRFGWEIETAPGGDQIAALWPLTAAALTPIPTKSGTQWFSGYTYGRGGDKKKLNPDRVFYTWRPHGLDFRQPESALEAAQLPVSISVMQARYDYSFLKNDARPAALIVTEAFEDDDSYEAFKQQWGSEFGGPDNAGRVAVLEATGTGDQGVKGAVDVTVLGISPKDAQAAQRSTQRQREIAMALGVPFSRLDASGRTFDNAKQEDEIFWRQTLIPLLTRLQNAVNVQLAPRLGPEFGWFDLSDIDVLNPAAAPVVDTPPVAPDLGEMMAGFEQRMTALVTPKIEVREPAIESTPTVPAPESDRTPEMIEARRAKLWTSADNRLRPLERQWERAIRRLFARQARAVALRLESKRGRGALGRGESRQLADEIFDPQHWLEETIDDVSGLYEAVAAAGGSRVSDMLGIAFDLEAPWVADFIQARANQLAGQVTTTTYEAIQGALSEGVAAGEGIPDLAARIKGVFDTASSARATTIARTEVVSAFNGSATATASFYGSDVVAGQEWIATRDSRVRDEHAERDGEIVGIDEAFSGGLLYPGDPSGDPGDTVNCRCTVAFLTPDEMTDAGRTARLIDRRVAHAAFRAWDPKSGSGAVKAAYREAA